MSLHRSPRRRVLQVLVATPALAQMSWAYAQNPAPKPEQFRDVKPVQPTESAARIEVVDFFWYGCTHCNAFLPSISAWKKTLPADVAYRYLPVAFDKSSDVHTSLFYTLEALNKVEELHPKVFAAMHTGTRRAFRTADEIADFAAANGIDRKLWLDTFNSFSVQTKAQRARQVWMGYKIEGTPTLGIDGRYWTSPSQAGSAAAALQVADALIDQLRRQRSGRK